MNNHRHFGNFMPSISLDQPLTGIDDMLEACQRQSQSDNIDLMSLHECSRKWEDLLAMAIEEKTLKAKIDAKRRDSAGKRALIAQWREHNYELYQALAEREGINPESIVSRNSKTGEITYHTEADGYIAVLTARRKLYDDIVREQEAQKITTLRARRESVSVRQQKSASRLGRCIVADTANLRRWEESDHAERASGAYLERD